jgi:DNA-binding MarR family transcriptional regulator/GNAT superfamily N-acetyltransferase
MDGIDTQVAEIRAFNRFHTRLVGALNEGLLASDFPLVQVRVLYDLAHADNLAAADLVARLGVDAGYMSRMIAALESRGLIEKTPDSDNAKRLVLSLSEAGRAVFARLDRASAEEVRQLISPLPEAERQQLVGAMRTIRRLLGDESLAPSAIIASVPAAETRFTLREPRPGDLGFIVHRQAAVYAAEYGWDWSYEALVARIVSDFVTHFDPASERCWIAEVDGEIAGSVFVVRHDETTAKLRLVYVEASARGMGLGRALVDEVIRFARERGYTRLELWTNSILVSARRIYEAAGFELIDEQPHRSFGQDLVGQTWVLKL